MPHYHSDHVKGYKQQDIPFTITGMTEKAERLAIFLPGAGYTTKAPLFHYASSLFLAEGMDVLEINYPYNDEFYENVTWEELIAVVNEDVNAVLDHVLGANRRYRNFIILSKSIGTLCTDSVIRREDIQDARAIWVTPLLKEEKVLEALAISKYESLCIMGDQDANYSPENLVHISQNPLLLTRVIPHMNHGLEADGHILESIDMMKHIMKDIRDFI